MRQNRMLVFHPKRNRILKAAWGILLVLAMTPLGISPTYGSAGPKNGDPFSNGTFWPSEGTFQAIMRGKNLTGVATFSTVGTGIEDITASGGGIFSVFFNGVTFVGNVNSAIDVHSGQIAATFEGSIPGQEGSGSTIVNSEFGLISETFESGGTTTNFEAGGTTSEQSVEQETTTETSGGSTETVEGSTIDLPAGGTATLPDGTGVIGPATITTGPATTTTDPTTTETTTPVVVTTSTTTPDVITSETTPSTLTQEFGFIDTIANFDFVDALYSAGAFVAQLRDSWPNQSFDGKGTFSFSQIVLSAEGIPVVATESVKIKVNGVRVADTVQTFTPFDIQLPGVVVSFEVQRGGTGGGGTAN